MPMIEVTNAQYERILDSFAWAVRKLREEHDEQQPEFGHRFGVGQSTISRWENGQSLPRMRKLVLLSRLEGVSIDWLMGFTRVRALPKLDDDRKVAT